MGSSAVEIPCLNIEVAKDGYCLTRDQQLALVQEVTRDEINRAVQDMPNYKSPGTDGIPVEFFKANWSIVGEEVIQVVTQFIESGKILKEINCTTITLIPKVQNPTYVKEYRPIACCTTLYKIISKVIVGVYAPTVITARLKKVVDKLVGESQTGFISGRSILDNVIVVHELVKGYSQKGLSHRCLIKIDIRKAYDSLEWNLLKIC
ncbi:hypothetical protein KY284_007646 [Solanum tuberosum]|nr:hypothetical protein KY284_007646 [Solanum tuberosum]